MKDNKKSNSPKRIKFFNKMTEKKLIPFLFLVFSLFFASYSFAAEVHFQWGSSSGDVEGYKIYYGSSRGGPYLNLLDQVEGTATECLATLNEWQEYYLVVRAFNDYGESGDSNEVVWPSGEGDDCITVAVNFQAANAPVPEGFLPDSGGYFNETAGYGWTAAPASYGARDRDNPISPDQAHDTMIHVAPSAAWEMAVPNGTYTVTVCVGDPSWPSNIQSVQVEGISVIDQEPLGSSQRWIEREAVVDVTDGSLTLTFDGCDITKLCYVLCEGGW